VCPKTGLPDFGVLTIRYMPREKCLELKSLKEYLFTYRNLGIFQENIVNQVLDDVVKATDPVWAEIKGDFRPRGGISTVVTARWPRTEEMRCWCAGRFRCTTRAGYGTGAGGSRC
jgi:7-cyano-7-deazaguanine reductase